MTEIRFELLIGYRSILRLGANDSAIQVAESQLSSWFRSKRRNGIETTDWDGPGDYQLGDSAHLSVVHGGEGLDGSNRRLYRFQEENLGGNWIVSVYALDTPNARASQQQSIVVEVSTEAPDTRSAITKVRTPRLVREILQAHDASDGSAPLTGSPQFIRGDGAEDVLTAILDPTRTASVIVAPVPFAEYEDNWRDIVKNLTVESVGVASTFVTDAAATQILTRELPPSHSVSAGVVRTYSPRVDIDVPDDRRRHLMLFPDTLARSLKGTRVATPLAKRHAESTRLRFIERELPSDVRRGMDLLRRAEAEQRRTVTVERTFAAVREQLRDAWTTDHETGKTSDKLSLLLTRWTGIGTQAATTDNDAVARLGAELEAKAAEVALLKEQFDQLVRENDAMRTELEATRGQFDELQLLTTIAEDDARKAERTATYLRQQLAAANMHGQLYVPAEDDIWEPPDGIYELLERITPGAKTHRAFSRVVFTGDEDTAMEIEKRGQGMRYAHAFWDYIRVLYDYAEGHSDGRINCGVHAYLTSDYISGHKCPADRHVPTESSTTLQRWGRERTLPVPPEVDPTGKVLMAAHFRPTWADTFAPRMHYYDDAANTGKMYVGYIGKHLPNTKS